MVNAQKASVLLASMMGEKKWQALQDHNMQEVIDSIKERLDKFCGDMQKKLIKCPFIVEDIVVRQGDPASQILKQASLTDCDLIVMGTHGQSALADAMLGRLAVWLRLIGFDTLYAGRLPGQGAGSGARSDHQIAARFVLLRREIASGNGLDSQERKGLR